VEHHVIKYPIGLWPKNKALRQVGQYQREISADGIAGLAFGTLCRGASWTKEEVGLYIVDVKKSLMDSKVHSYYPFHGFMDRSHLMVRGPEGHSWMKALLQQ